MLFATILNAQLNIDTLAFQDFEIAPASPVWNFTGPVIYNSGYSSATTAAPTSSPIGIGGSRAWETTTNSAGLVLNFANTIIPVGYDSVRVRFNLAAMNLVSTGGGPDDLDYVLVTYSTDAGLSFVNRIRIRGAVANNSYWPYSATGFAQSYYLPASETVFQPLVTGLQTTLGYSTVEIVFPGSITQLQMRITGRSSSSTDTWLVDNLVLIGENVCTNSTSSQSANVCGSYTAPSGTVLTSSGVYNDTIPNSTGCDSVITINLTVNNATSSSLNTTACGTYTSPSGVVHISSGTYLDTIPNTVGCDSVITINLIVNAVTSSSLNATACGIYTAPSGTVYSASGTYMDTIANSLGCDSIITIGLTVNSNSSSTITVSSCFSYVSPSGNTYTNSGTYLDTIPNASGCDSVITTSLTINSVDVTTTLVGATLSANASSATYQWIDCGNGNAILPGETNQSFSPATNGNYAVIVTENSCSDTSACVMVLSVGIGNSTGLVQVLFNPNPTSGLFVLTTGSVLINATFRLVDIQGKLIWTEEQKSGINFNIDISDQSSGVYFLEVVENGETKRSRIVKY